MNNIKTFLNIPRFVAHLILFVVFYERCLDDLMRECKNTPPINYIYIGDSCI